MEKSLEYKHKKYKLNEPLIKLLFAYKYKCLYDRSTLLVKFLYLLLVLILCRSIMKALFWVGIFVVTYIGIWCLLHHIYKQKITQTDSEEQIDTVYHMLQKSINKKHTLIKLVENGVPTILIDPDEFPNSVLTKVIYLEGIREGVISKRGNAYPIYDWSQEILKDYNLCEALKDYEKPLLEFIKKV